MINKMKVCLVSISFLFSSIGAADGFEKIATVVERVCKAPSDKKSSYYKISAKGDASIKVSLVGLIGGTADFKREEWDGVQRVLRAQQADDNKSFRECSMKLTPVFISKFLESIEKAESSNKGDSGNKIIINGDNAKIGTINQ